MNVAVSSTSPVAATRMAQVSVRAWVSTPTMFVYFPGLHPWQWLPSQDGMLAGRGGIAPR